MNVDLSLPTTLYKANQDLILHLGRLMQQSQLRWAEFLQQQSRTAMAPFSVTNAVQPFTALMRGEWPADAVWTSMQGNTRQWQATVEAALENQTAFVDEFRAAISTWQHACGEALQAPSTSIPLSPDLKTMMDMFTAPPGAPAAAAEAVESTKRPASGKAPRK